MDRKREKKNRFLFIIRKFVGLLLCFVYSADGVRILFFFYLLKRAKTVLYDLFVNCQHCEKKKKIKKERGRKFGISRVTITV